MKWIKLFEDFKKNNEEGTLITQDDVIDCIKASGVVYASIVIDLPGNDPKVPLKAVSIDNDGLVTVEIDGKEYEVELRNISKIEF